VRPGEDGWLLSVSAAQSYLRCPWAFRMRYVERHEHPTGWTRPEHVRVGTAVHAALEAALLARQADPSAAPGTLEPYAPDARTALKQAWDREGLPWTEGGYDNALGAVLGTLAALPAPAPADILGVEWRIETNTLAGTPLVIVIDLALRTGPTAARVVDWKHRSRPRDRIEILYDWQLNLYAWVLAAMLRADTITIGQYYPPVQTGVAVPAQPRWMDSAVEQIDAVAERILTEQEWRPRVGDHCAGCPWQAAHCPAWPQGETTP